MQVVKTDDQFIFIVAKEDEIPEGGRNREAIFVPLNVFYDVRTFVEVAKIEVDEDYWEDNRHDKIRNLLITMTGFSSRDISNSLSALGL